MDPIVQTPPPSTGELTLVRCVDLPSALAGASPAVVHGVIASLGAQLTQLGWQPASSAPGSNSFTRGGRILALDQVIPMVAGGHITSAIWASTCANDGITNLQVPIPMAGSVAPGPAVQVDPFTLPPRPLQPPTSRSSGWKTLLIVIACVWIAAGAVILRVHRESSADDHLANHRGIDGQSEVAADGKLEAGQGQVSTSYVKQNHEFEVYSLTTSGLEFPNLASVEASGIHRWSTNGRSYIDLKYSKHTVNLDRPGNLKTWVADRNISAAKEADSGMVPIRGEVDGRTSWTWEYVTPKGWWVKTTRIPDGKASYTLNCRLMPELDNPEARARCNQALEGLQIRRAK